MVHVGSTRVFALHVIQVSAYDDTITTGCDRMTKSIGLGFKVGRVELLLKAPDSIITE
jgi:hypothetical protein